MDIIHEQEPYVQEIGHEWHGGRVAELAMLRLDVIHTHVSGNKWYKLKYNVEYCRSHGISTILTFGGAHSNHLTATAAMANTCGLQSIGIIKGTYAENQLTPALQFCMDNGMQLVFATHEDYAKKHDTEWLAYLSSWFNNPMIIPEGGANEQGRKGAAEIGGLIPQRFTHIAVSVGTGTTLAGIANAVGDDVQVSGFAPMRGGKYIGEEISQHISRDNFMVYDDWHFGGFGKYTDQLGEFMNRFYTEHNIPLDRVYTAKMMYGLKEQVQSGLYPPEASILAVHTGGLQGNITLKNVLVF